MNVDETVQKVFEITAAIKELYDAKQKLKNANLSRVSELVPEFDITRLLQLGREKRIKELDEAIRDLFGKFCELFGDES